MKTENPKISIDLLNRLLEISKEAYPREIAGMLLKEKNIINDFVILPGNYNTNSVNMYSNSMPIYTNSVGTFHSHPSPNSNPSKADLNFFAQKAGFHLIIAYPYVFNSIAVYDNAGKPVQLQVVQ